MFWIWDTATVQSGEYLLTTTAVQQPPLSADCMTTPWPCLFVPLISPSVNASCLNPSPHTWNLLLLPTDLSPFPPALTVWSTPPASTPLLWKTQPCPPTSPLKWRVQEEKPLSFTLSTTHQSACTHRTPSWTLSQGSHRQRDTTGEDTQLNQSRPQVFYTSFALTIWWHHTDWTKPRV